MDKIDKHRTKMTLHGQVHKISIGRNYSLFGQPFLCWFKCALTEKGSTNGSLRF